MNRGTWTPERIARLTELWLDGSPASKIGAALGLSKNAVVGKAHRLELAKRASPIRHCGQQTTRKEVVARATPQSEVSVPLAPPQSEAAVARPRATCQWIAGEPSADDACKCGAEVGASRIYCPAHERRARVRVRVGGAA